MSDVGDQNDIHEDSIVAGLALGDGPVGRGDARDVGDELAVLVDGRGGVGVDRTSGEGEDASVADLRGVPLAGERGTWSAGVLLLDYVCVGV